MDNIKILNKEILSQRKYPLEWITFSMPDRKGEIQKKDKEVYYRPDSVSVLLVEEEKEKLLFTKQFRLPTFLNGNETGYLLETCAGLIDEGETPVETAHREVEEETGYAITDLKKIGGVYTSAGGLTEFLHLFIARYESENDHDSFGGLEEEAEEIELVELTFDEAREKLTAGEIFDAKTMILLQHFFMGRS